MTLRLLVNRQKKSYDFKAEPHKPDSFSNNWKNNSLDELILFAGKTEVFRCKCQSVANYCFGNQLPGDTVKHGDSIAEGDFTIKCFVPPRNFAGEIHAITKTRDIDGQWIDRNAMQTTKDGFQNGRWLIHSKFSKRLMRDTNYAWSAGCIILSTVALESLNAYLKKLGVKAGDELHASLVEVK